MRPLHLLDLPLLVPFLTQATANEAMTLQSLLQGQASLQTLSPLTKTWLPGGGHQPIILGWNETKPVVLLAFRTIANCGSWEIEQCRLLPKAGVSLPDILGEMNPVTTKAHIHRFFIRLPEASNTTNLFRRAGFSHHISEIMYELSRSISLSYPDYQQKAIQVRSVESSDLFELFRLYNAVMPLAIRQAEGMTFNQWADSDKIRWGPNTGLDRVAESRQGLLGWIRIRLRGRIGIITILSPDNSPEIYRALINEGMHLLKNANRILVLTPEGPGPARNLLPLLGFRELTRFTTLIRQFPRPSTAENLIYLTQNAS